MLTKFISKATSRRWTRFPCVSAPHHLHNLTIGGLNIGIDLKLKYIEKAVYKHASISLNETTSCNYKPEWICGVRKTLINVYTK